MYFFYILLYLICYILVFIAYFAVHYTYNKPTTNVLNTKLKTIEKNIKILNIFNLRCCKYLKKRIYRLYLKYFYKRFFCFEYNIKQRRIIYFYYKKIKKMFTFSERFSINSNNKQYNVIKALDNNSIVLFLNIDYKMKKECSTDKISAYDNLLVKIEIIGKEYNGIISEKENGVILAIFQRVDEAIKFYNEVYLEMIKKYNIKKYKASISCIINPMGFQAALRSCSRAVSYPMKKGLLLSKNSNKILKKENSTFKTKELGFFEFKGFPNDPIFLYILKE